MYPLNFMSLDKNTKKIRYLIKSLRMGGTERHLFQLTTELAARGWAVSILTIEKNNPLKRWFEDRGIPIKTLDLPELRRWVPSPLRRVILTLISIVKLHRVFIEEPIPTHFFLPHAYLLGMVSNLLTGKKGITFMSRRSLNLYQAKVPGSRTLERFFHGQVTAIFGNSKAVVDQLLQEGAGESKTHLIYNGVDTNKIAIEQNTKSLPILADLFIYCVGNFVPYKGHRDLIDAAAELKNETEVNWHIACFGRDDGVLNSLKSYANEKGVLTHFSWIENELEPWRFMKPEQIGVLPSHQEGFSNAILELMACRLAVIATDVGGNPEALGGMTGIIVPPRNPHELKNSIKSLLQSATIRSEYSRRAREKTEKAFSIPSCIESYEKLYHYYLDSTKKPS